MRDAGVSESTGKGRGRENKGGGGGVGGHGGNGDGGEGKGRGLDQREIAEKRKTLKTCAVLLVVYSLSTTLNVDSLL